MTEYFIETNKKVIKKIVISGHAEYAPKGEDIVCASVSTAIIMTVNQIEIFDLLKNVALKIEEGYFQIEVLKDNDIINKLLINLEYTLNDLEINFKKYIKKTKEA